MQTLIRNIRRPAALLALLGAGIEPAFAHHAMGGATPETFGQGFVSGLAHPVIGVDHLVFVIAVGLLAVACGRRYSLPLAFIAATAVGAMLAVTGANVPLVELAVAISLVVAGGLLISGGRVSAQALVTLFGLAGVFHGLAYGSSIVGAEPTPLLAYLAGFSLVQYAVAVGAGLLATATRRAARSPALAYERIVGGVVSGVALVFLAEHLESMVFAVA